MGLRERDDHPHQRLTSDPGTGKTHLAPALGICACEQGCRVRFATLASLANELSDVQAAHALARGIVCYARFDVLTLDVRRYRNYAALRLVADVKGLDSSCK